MKAIPLKGTLVFLESLLDYSSNGEAALFLKNLKILPKDTTPGPMKTLDIHYSISRLLLLHEIPYERIVNLMPRNGYKTPEFLKT